MAMREFIDFIMFHQDYGNNIGWFAYLSHFQEDIEVFIF
jgi:hypothetical protein